MILHYSRHFTILIHIAMDIIMNKPVSINDVTFPIVLYHDIMYNAVCCK